MFEVVELRVSRKENTWTSMAVIFEYSNISHFRLPFSTREKGSYLKPTILSLEERVLRNSQCMSLQCLSW